MEIRAEINKSVCELRVFELAHKHGTPRPTTGRKTLTAMFGEVLNREANNTLVEDSNGDVNADAAMHIIGQTEKLKKQNSCNDTSVDTFLNNAKQNSQQNEAIQNTLSTNQAPKTSYAFTAAAKSTGAVPKILSKPAKSISQPSSCWTQDLRKIVNNHELGNRTLILMRGLPGSGKTFLAKKVVDACIGTDPLTTYDDHIFSTDDYFTNHRGVYHYNKTQLTQAHSWNQHRADMQLMRGVSPVIIDNTNIELWEMIPYVKSGVSNGYIIEILMPKTPWAKNTYLLAENNLHGVPFYKIKKMRNKFSPMTSNDLLSSIKIAYPTEMVPPPVKRVIPPIDESSISPEKKVEKTVSVESNSSQWGNQRPVEQIPFLDHHNNNMGGDEKTLTQNYERDSKYDTAQALPLYEEAETGAKCGPVLAEKKPPPKPLVGVELVALLMSKPEYEPYSYSVSDFCGFEENESMVNLHLNWELVRQLEKTSGCEGVSYPIDVKYIINVPNTLLHEINAYWIESLMTQTENHEQENAKLLKEDEEFAKCIQQKELELHSLGKEPKIPDFKEIMSLDIALHSYQKKVDEWRDKTPDDIAARMTRDNLFNIFPELSQDLLTEMLMAHHNNFKNTVETVLMSTGRHNVLEDESGLNKFLLHKQMERQQKVLKEQEKALTEAEWSVLPPDETVDMSSLKKHRDLAEQHLNMRKLNIDNARNYIRRGMTTVASHYSELAHFHTNEYEQQASLAAASLVQLQAVSSPNNATLDLHYLRVAEATAALDLFLDMHINRLKEFQARNKGPRMQKVFLITGRGAHSEAGRARVKPAVKHRLKERGLVVSECNPGLLTARVTAVDKLSYQVTPE